MADTIPTEAYVIRAASPDMGGTEYDVWRIADSGERLIASYAFKHQATEVADALNKWSTAEL